MRLVYVFAGHGTHAAGDDCCVSGLKVVTGQGRADAEPSGQ